MRRAAEAEVGAKDDRTKLYNEFLNRVGGGTEAAAEVAVAALRRSRPVGQFIGKRRVEAFRVGRGECADEGGPAG